MKTPELRELPEYSEIPLSARTTYFLNYALRERRAELDFILHIAKLKVRHDPDTRIGWNNVMKHNVAQSAAMNVLGNALKLPDGEVRRLARYAFLHNPKICRDVTAKKKAAGKKLTKAEEFSTFEGLTLDREFATWMSTTDPDGALRLATSPEFFLKIASMRPKPEEKVVKDETLEEKADRMNFSDLLAYYVDALFDDGNLIPAHERIALMEKRRPDLNADGKYTQALGMQYWDAERAVSTHIEKRVWEQLKANAIELDSPTDVPEFIRKQLGQDMLKHWETMQER